MNKPVGRAGAFRAAMREVGIDASPRDTLRMCYHDVYRVKIRVRNATNLHEKAEKVKGLLKTTYPDVDVQPHLSTFGPTFDPYWTLVARWPVDRHV